MEAYLEGLGLNHTGWLAAVSAMIVLGGALVAFVVHKAVYPLVIRITSQTPTSLDARIIIATRAPVNLAVLLVAIYLAIILPWNLPQAALDIINIGARLVGVFVMGWIITQGIGAVSEWYAEEIAPHTKSELDDRLIPLARRVATGIVIALGILVALDQLNVNISPLIAGLGLGGLAVALAVQPTLSNIFAGTYVLTEGVVSPGDYIELESGVAGYVLDVSWRSTRLRTWGNNLVVIPNSRFAETIITNYQEPRPEMNVYLPCGVSYDSDLRVVEQVCQEVMDHVLATDPNAVKEYGGWFGFESFGDSNVDFWLFVQARDRLASFPLRTRLMQDLHQRLLQEGIVINYPVRTLQFPPEWTPNGPLPSAAPGAASAAARDSDGNRTPTRRRIRRTAPRPGTHIFPDSPSGAPEGFGPDGPGAG